MAGKNYSYDEDSNQFVERQALQGKTPQPQQGSSYQIPSMVGGSSYNEGINAASKEMQGYYGMDQYNQRMNKLYKDLDKPGLGFGKGINGGGGGGGGGTKVPGYSDQFLNFQKNAYADANKLATAESPFGQSAIGRRTEEIDIGMAGQREQLAQRLASQGFGPGTPQYEKAMSDLDFDANRQKAGVIQQMFEADAQYGLQKSEVLRGYFQTFHTAEMQNRQMLMEGQRMNAAAAAQASAAASADAKWRFMAKLGIAEKQFDTRSGYKQQQFQNFMSGAAFDFGKAQWGSEFEYTKQYNSQMIQLQRDLASQAAAQQRKGGILGFLGKAIGGIGGFLLGGPAGAAAGLGIGGGLFGGGGSSSPIGTDQAINANYNNYLYGNENPSSPYDISKSPFTNPINF